METNLKTEKGALTMTTDTAVKALQLGDIAPDFTAESTQGTIEFHKWLGNGWAVFFSHPKDYTPVCTTELGDAARKSAEFKKRGVKVVALSVDPLDSHKGWINDINETQQVTVDYPIIADPDRRVANLYGMIHPKALDSFTVRTVFIIDPNKKIRLMMTYPAPTGRNFDEILRVIDALQLTDSHSVATPVNWKQGGDCIILPSVKDPEELKKKFPKGYKELRPYLRLTPQPDK
jgi:alkyl hydroperoxide reductase subunit AhpC